LNIKKLFCCIRRNFQQCCSSFVSRFNLSKSSNYTHYLFYKKCFKSEISSVWIWTWISEECLQTGLKTRVYIQRQGSMLAWIIILSVMAQIQLQKLSYLSLSFCADLVTHEINFWVSNISHLHEIISTSLIINLQWD
jgi:hypothetical protein